MMQQLDLFPRFNNVDAVEKGRGCDVFEILFSSAKKKKKTIDRVVVVFRERPHGTYGEINRLDCY